MMIGKIIENYKIIKHLGTGGMGTVYLAEDIMLGRKVAIKMLHPELLYKEEVLARFKTEAKTLAKLNHPNIAILFNLIESGGNYYMIMEYVDGISLENLLLEQGAIAANEAIDIVAQALNGIQHAHNRNIIHRDIKPANLMINKENIVKVMDFGIARALGSARMTRTGSVVGTLEYMSPEQIRGEEGDERSDIYAMGIVLYELLTGNVPFRSKSDYDLMTKKLNEKPPEIRSFWHEIPKSLEKVVMKAINKDPDLRFQSAEQFRAALLQCKSGFDVSENITTGVPQKKHISFLGGKKAKLPYTLFQKLDFSNKKLINGLALFILLLIVGSGAYFLRQKRLAKIRMAKNKIQYATDKPVSGSKETETADIPPASPQQTSFAPPANIEIPAEISQKDKEKEKRKRKNKEKKEKKKQKNKTSHDKKKEKNKTKNEKSNDKNENTKNENENQNNITNKKTTGKSGSENSNTEKAKEKKTEKKKEENSASTGKSGNKNMKTRIYNAYIEKNTPLVIALPKEISSLNESLEGQTIFLYVDTPITENGIDILPRGSKVYCTVNKIKKGKGRKRGIIEIEAKYAIAPDGTHIPLKNGIFRIMGKRGENVFFKKGQKFKVKIAKNKKFIVKY